MAIVIYFISLHRKWQPALFQELDKICVCATKLINVPPCNLSNKQIARKVNQRKLDYIHKDKLL